VGILKDGPQLCDCCNRERLALVRNGKLIITDRRGGVRHILSIPIDNKEAIKVESNP
jgi:hypothetical protein